jgi:hypothetical protein
MMNGAPQIGDNELLTVPELAKRLRVRTSWIYGHADELGAFRLGKYLRFSWNRVLSQLADRSNSGPRGVDVGVPAQRPSEEPIDSIG